MSLQTIRFKQPFPLECGVVLPEITIAYHTFGTFHPAHNNVVWIAHALTANSNPSEWWKGLVGTDRIIDPERHFIVCANILGSCYGTTGPLAVNPTTGRGWYGDFPLITVRDIAKAHELLRQHLGIERIWLGLGGSMGGCQLLEWAVAVPNLFQQLALIATSAQESPWGIAIHAAQRMAIEASATWGERNFAAAATGLEAARAIGMLSYRTANCFNTTQQEVKPGLSDFKAESYQRYQGQKLAKRFNSYSYHTLLTALDSHHVGRGRGSTEAALAAVTAKTLVIGISTDLLYPVTEQEELAHAIPDAQLEVIDSLFGHDGFLLETAKLSTLLSKHFPQVKQPGVWLN